MKDAKGHGSNAHTAGIAALPQPFRVHPKVLATINKNPGGFSVKPTNGKQPNNGFMVSIPGYTQIVNEAALRGPGGAKLISDYAAQNAHVLAHPDAHIGGWTDQTSGKTYLDVSHNVQGRSAAISTGKAHNQIAIWDVKHAKEIRTGGTGD